jgi:hypothetical protein
MNNSIEQLHNEDTPLEENTIMKEQQIDVIMGEQQTSTDFIPRQVTFSGYNFPSDCFVEIAKFLDKQDYENLLSTTTDIHNLLVSSPSMGFSADDMFIDRVFNSVVNSVPCSRLYIGNWYQELTQIDYMSRLTILDMCCVTIDLKAMAKQLVSLVTLKLTDIKFKEQEPVDLEEYHLRHLNNLEVFDLKNTDPLNCIVLRVPNVTLVNTQKLFLRVLTSHSSICKLKYTGRLHISTIRDNKVDPDDICINNLTHLDLHMKIGARKDKVVFVSTLLSSINRSSPNIINLSVGGSAKWFLKKSNVDTQQTLTWNRLIQLKAHHRFILDCISLLHKDHKLHTVTLCDVALRHLKAEYLRRVSVLDISLADADIVSCIQMLCKVNVHVDTLIIRGVVPLDPLLPICQCNSRSVSIYCSSIVQNTFVDWLLKTFGSMREFRFYIPGGTQLDFDNQVQNTSVEVFGLSILNRTCDDVGTYNRVLDKLPQCRYFLNLDAPLTTVYHI